MKKLSISVHSLTQADAAAILGVSPQALRSHKQPCPRNADGTYDGAVVVQYAVDRALSKVAAPVDSDAMYQEYRARRQALLYEKELGLLLDRDQVMAGLRASFTMIRQLGEDLQKQFGSDAYDMVTETLDDAKEAAFKAIREYRPADGKAEDLEEPDEPKKRPAKAKSRR